MKIEISGNGKLNWSFTVKLIILAFMALVLLIPLEMIKSVVLERQANSEAVTEEISSQWGGTQVITGPVLNIPLREVKRTKDGETVYYTVMHLMPELNSSAGNIKSQKRSYGIYETVIYTADLNSNGTFRPDLMIIPDGFEPLYKEAYVTVGITDNRGLNGAVEFSVNDKSLTPIPGTKDKDISTSGVTFMAGDIDFSGLNTFALKFKINGSGGLYFTPTGKETNVDIESDWNSPGFKGNFLPGNREINEDGFSATWTVTDLNRNFPQFWTGNSQNIENEAFGVEMILPVDHYLKSHRSVRYGVLFILLTFLALLFIELMTGANIHLFHYLLVALGLVLFFSILTSASEHIGFGPAYLISAAAITGLLAFFTANLLKSFRHTAIFILLLVLLYTFIYILLNLTDYAFLAGNIGLFISLLAIMYASLKVRFESKEEQA